MNPALADFDPILQRWFAERFESPTEPQTLGWPEIAAGRDTLISAPTGSGKTLAAFLIRVDRLVRAAREGTLADQTQVIYVSPLKALSNDIQRNLETRLAVLTHKSTLWEEKKPAANRIHPTSKPVELVERAFLNSSKAGDVVADLFGGSGSTSAG